MKNLLTVFIGVFISSSILWAQEHSAKYDWPELIPYSNNQENEQKSIESYSKEEIRQWGLLQPVRFFSMDRFDHKYPSLTPYHYAANNPVYFIDINGDSINVKKIQESDKKNDTNNMNKIITDLQTQTGLTLKVNKNGQLVYVTEDGKPVIATNKDGSSAGSATARNLLIKAIGTTKQAYVTLTSGGSRVPAAGSPLIKLNVDQITQFQSGASANLNSATMGWGMTFMHEMLHSNVGLAQSDPNPPIFGQTGPVVDMMNTVRGELGADYGQRMSYGEQVVNNGQSFIPFDQDARRMLKKGYAPHPKSLFIKY